MTTPTDETRLATRRKTALVSISLTLIAGGAAFALYYTQVLAKEQQTDNAYVGGNLVTLTSQVSGNVTDILADETQAVHAGAPLVKLDPTDAEVALTQAQAHLGAVVRQLRAQYAEVGQYDALTEVKRLAVRKAEDDLARRLPLTADHTVSEEDARHASQAVDEAKAQLEVALRQASAARAAVAGVGLTAHPAVQAARAEVVQAWLAARRNAIPAPVTGYVAKRAVQIGSHVTPGTPLMTIVPLDQLWVDANFKESELTPIRIGQKATIEADMYGSKVRYHGTVLGLSAGTGSAFSLLPAENANGNWIKVVQRVPVRISLDPKELAEHPLRVGLSTTVTVDVSTDGAALASAPASTGYATQALTQPLTQGEAVADAIIARNLGQ